MGRTAELFNDGENYQRAKAEETGFFGRQETMDESEVFANFPSCYNTPNM